jgi:hypothetical protein
MYQAWPSPGTRRQHRAWHCSCQPRSTLPRLAGFSRCTQGLLATLTAPGCCLPCLQSGPCADPPFVLIQVVTEGLARGDMDVNQAAAILGSVLPMQTLLQMAMGQQPAPVPVPAPASAVLAAASAERLLPANGATWSAELGWVWS